MSKREIIVVGDSSREGRIKLGFAERIDFPGGRIQLSWEVWGGMRPLKARWLLAVEHSSGVTDFKAYDDFEEAVAAFEREKLKYAVAIARAALGLGKRRLN